MAKLNPKDPQFGIPIASRIKETIAFRLNKEAGKAGKTFSRYVAEYIEKADANEKRIAELTAQLDKEKTRAAEAEKQQRELQAQLTREKELTKRVASQFIVKISEGKPKQANQLIETYNNILKNERTK